MNPTDKAQTKYYRKTYKTIIFVAIPFWILAYMSSTAQSYRYYTSNFSEESSLLGGAVIGGGSAAASIYFNPASISAVGKSQFTLNSSLVYFDYCIRKNALGQDIDLEESNLKFTPRFVSYLKTADNLDKNLTLEVATFSRENYHREFNYHHSTQRDILNSLPGEENYLANFQLVDDFSDYCIVIGASYSLNQKLSVGTTLLSTIKSMRYWYSYDLMAFSSEDAQSTVNEKEDSYIASFSHSQYVRFNDYRLLFIAGFLYQTESLAYGLRISTPSFNVYEDGKEIYKGEKQQNITNPNGSGFLPDYAIEDAQIKKQVRVNYRDPFSLGAGISYNTPDGRKNYYLSVEYSLALEPYVLVEVKDNTIATTGLGSEEPTSQDWLNCVSGGRPIFNFALGAKWKASENVLILAGFRTNFNSIKDFDYSPYESINQLITEPVDLYQFSFGANLKILKNSISSGISYSLGTLKNQTQLLNLSDPVEYNPEEGTALQGSRLDVMDINLYQINFFLGLTLNWPKPDQ